MKILSYACNYPDKEGSGLKDMDDNPYHGFLWQRQYKTRIVNNKEERYDYNPLYDSNYIANYIFLTKLALKNGVVEEVERGAMLQNDYSRIYEDFKDRKIGASSWSDVLAKVGVVDTNENRRMFIYGIAIHLITDVYAHSTWYWSEAAQKWNRVTHNSKDKSLDADNTARFPKRYVAAKEAANKVLMKVYYGQMGSLNDFINAPSAYSGYYIANFAAYAQAADSETYTNLKTYFKYGDLWYNVLNESKIYFEKNPILKAGE